MNGNPQNIEVGDVVSFESIDDKITAVVLSIWEQGYLGIEEEHTIDGYRVRATVMSRGSFANIAVDKLTIVRKWNDSIHNKNVTEVKSQPTYRFVVTSDKTKETMELATRMIASVSDADILEIERDDHIVVVTHNFAEGIGEFVCSYSDTDFVFDPVKCKFVDGDTELSFQTFIDEELRPICISLLIQKELKN